MASRCCLLGLYALMLDHGRLFAQTRTFLDPRKQLIPKPKKFVVDVYRLWESDFRILSPTIDRSLTGINGESDICFVDKSAGIGIGHLALLWGESGIARCCSTASSQNHFVVRGNCRH